MIPDAWARFSQRWVWCATGEHPSPDLDGPDEAITWAETHPCSAAVAA